MSNRLIYTVFIAIVATVLLSSCGKSHVGYSSPPPVKHYPKASASHSSGKKKIGKPYKIAGQWYYPLQSAAGYNQSGVASWYGKDFHGKLTANGERYDMHAMSAAHKTLPLPTMVRVTNLDNGRQIVVRVNDRGPFVKNRIIDLSYAAAKALGYDKKGTARVRVQALEGVTTTSAPAASPSAISTQQAVKPSYSAKPVPSSSAYANSYGDGQIYIQIGAFSSQANAQRLKDELRASFPNARIQQAAANMTTWYRVQIGPYADVQYVENIVLDLEQKGYNNTIVVIK